MLYISYEVVLQIHRLQIEEFGGASGLRNESGLRSAIELLKATFDGNELYPSVFSKASVYAFHIAEAQAFVDGNKRVALDVALTFLAINGFEIAGEEDSLYSAMMLVSQHGMSKEELSKLFERLCSIGLS